ncbi:DUF1176 domain-containing protein [Acetobacter sp. TBRC 12305]|uniref:DUF1176 domain-containing protein n=1 Tax=Acetobacter garciniae TaxID=2817435 RepID=A0A939HM97_9PROT|nr:DUF1176 domain-containing protein [Acetobacter garciniae]MBO1324666.1 DUF1176 domain-containing protein [Acetobacter garciniae]MBX0344355.1 DUF1176 domain-containing protein [Acetobacter garciniae]
MDIMSKDGRMKSWWGLMVILSLWAGHAWAATPSYNTYGTWFVVCDNGLACDARGFSDDGRQDAELVFRRPAGPEGETSVTIYAPLPVNRTAIRMDGRELVLPAASWTSGDDGSLSTRQPAAVAAFLARIRNATSLRVEKDSAPVPLKGLVAALSRMDARQGRMNGQTALVRRGTRPARMVPAPPPLPHIPLYHAHIMFDAGEPQRLMARTRKLQADFISRQDCDPPTDATQKYLKNDVYGLDDNNALVVIGCQMGPYQGWSLLFVVPRVCGATCQRGLARGGPLAGARPETAGYRRLWSRTHLPRLRLSHRHIDHLSPKTRLERLRHASRMALGPHAFRSDRHEFSGSLRRKRAVG